MAVTTNMLTGGLQMAFHPLNADKYADKLTNALNATLVTDNGNYNTLQQELGNARVESAYLPCGYIPLGCSEFGGVMYIVSYNPFTGKSQIGSFPSPERNITSDERDDLEQGIDYTSFFDKDAKASNKENALIGTYSKIYPIGENVTLKPGDEFFNFLIYSSTDRQKSESLLDYGITDLLSNNGKMGLIKITLYAKSNNNNITDITDSLRKVYDINSDGNNDMPFYVFSDSQNPDIDEFISGFDRNDSPYIVWNQNYSGELIANIEVEVVNEFDIAIDTERIDGDTDSCKVTFKPSVDDTHKDLWMNGVCEFNGKLYLTEDEAKADGASSDDIIKHPGGVHICLEMFKPDDMNPHQNIINEYYTVDQNTNEFSFDIKDYGEYNLLKYTVTPYMYCGDIEALTREGIIDLSKVNTNRYEITKWKYYNGMDDNSTWTTTLSCHIDYYPKKGCYISNPKLTFYDLLAKDYTSSFDVTGLDQFASMGDFAVDFTAANGLRKDTVYLVRLSFDEKDEHGDPVARENLGLTFVLNTSIMYNDEYINSEILDFNTFKPKATADVAIRLEKAESEDIEDVLSSKNKYNKESSFSNEELERGNTIYSCNKRIDKIKPDVKPTYNLFKVTDSEYYAPDLSFEYNGYSIDYGSYNEQNEPVVQDGERPSSHYKDFLESFEDGFIKCPADYEDKCDRNWQSLEYDGQERKLTRTAGIHITMYGEQEKKSLDLTHEMVSMTSDDMASNFWRSRHKNRTGGGYTMYTANDANVPEGVEPKNEFTECNILFYQNKGSFTKTEDDFNPRSSRVLYTGSDSLSFESPSNIDGYYKFFTYSQNRNKDDYFSLTGFKGAKSKLIIYPDQWKKGGTKNVDGVVNFLDPGSRLFQEYKEQKAPYGLLACNIIAPEREKYDTHGDPKNQLTFNKSYNYVLGGNIFCNGYEGALKGDLRFDLYATKYANNYNIYTNTPNFIGGVDLSNDVKPLAIFNNTFSIRNDITGGFNEGVNSTFPGCFFMFALNGYDNTINNINYIADYNIFPTGIEADSTFQIEDGFNQIPVVMSGGGVDISLDIQRTRNKLEDCKVKTDLYKINRYISHEADFGQPVYKLFSRIYIATKKQSTIPNFYYLNNITYYVYKSITFSTRYNIPSDDGKFAGNIWWSNGLKTLGNRVIDIMEWDINDYVKWNGRQNLTIEPIALSVVNNNLSVPADNTIQQTIYSPSEQVLYKKIHFTESRIVYKANGGYTLTDKDGSQFQSEGIYNIDSTSNELRLMGDDDFIEERFNVTSKIQIQHWVISSNFQGNYNQEQHETQEKEQLIDYAVYFVRKRWKVIEKNNILCVNKDNCSLMSTMYPMALCFNGGELHCNDNRIKYGVNSKIDTFSLCSHWLENNKDTDFNNKYGFSQMPNMAHFFLGKEDKGIPMYNILGPNQD